MKRMLIVLAGICLAIGSKAQEDSTRQEKADTIRIGNMVIIKKPGDKQEDEEHHKRRNNYKPSNISTSWLQVDLGLNQFHDQTDYAAAIASGQLPAGATEDWFDLRNGKSVNVNIWIFMQRLNIIKNIVNLKYGMGVELNNYKYQENIRYQDDATPVVIMDLKDFEKNKLAADYITVPMMLNFNFTPNKKHGFGFSVGASAGYLYSSRQKIVNDEDGKKKFRGDYDLRDWKISYIGELSLGYVKLYGSYATKSMFKNALDQTPYNFGVRFSNW